MGKRMKALVLGLAALLALCLAMPSAALASSLPSFSEDARVLLVDERTGAVVFEQGADERAYPASLTKMMTALVTLDVVGERLDERVEVGEEVALTPYDSTLMGLEVGDSFTWRELLYGMLIPSGSDAALVIATHVGRIAADDPSLAPEDALARFVELMNARAETMGLSGTHFANVHGFHDDNHYSCARDLLELVRAVRADALLSEICGTATYHCTSTEGRELTVFSTNWLLDETCGAITADGLLENEGEGEVENPYYRKNCTGVKTGYTSEAGRCLAFACSGADVDLVGVVLGLADQPTMYAQMGQVCDAAAAALSVRTWDQTAAPVKLRVTNASLLDRLRGKSKLAATAAEPVSSVVDAACTYETRIVWNEAYVQVGEDGSATLLTVVSQGAQVATFELWCDGELVHSVPLLATAGRTPFGNLDIVLLIAAGVVLLMVVVAVIVSVVRRQRRKARRSATSNGRGRARRGLSRHSSGVSRSGSRTGAADQASGRRSGAAQVSSSRSAAGSTSRTTGADVQRRARRSVGGSSGRSTGQTKRGASHMRKG